MDIKNIIKKKYLIDRYDNDYKIFIKNKNNNNNAILFYNCIKKRYIIEKDIKKWYFYETLLNVKALQYFSDSILNYNYIGYNNINYYPILKDSNLLNVNKKQTVLDFCNYPELLESSHYYRNNIKNNAHGDDKYICVPIMDIIDEDVYNGVKKHFKYKEYTKRYGVEFIGYDFKDILNIFKTKQCLDFINNIKKKYNNDLDLIIIDPRMYSLKNIYNRTRIFFKSGIYISRMAQMYWILLIITLNISKKGSDLILYFFELPIGQEIYNQLIYLISLYYEEVSFMNKYLIAKNFKGDILSAKRNPEDLLSVIEKWNKMDPTGGQFIKLEDNEFFDIYNEEFEKANPELDNKIKNQWNTTPVTSVLEFEKPIKNDFTDALAEHYKQMEEYYIDYYTKTIDLYKTLTFSAKTKGNASLIYKNFQKITDISKSSVSVYSKYCPYITNETSNAGLKMFEILTKFKLLDKFKNSNNKLSSFHICELPGNFIKVFQNMKIKNWDWWAQSLSDKHSGWAFGNRYGLVKNNPNKYLFGPNKNNKNKGGTGDITDIKNIKYYIDFLKTKKINIITSDCGDWSDALEKAEKSNKMSKVMYSQFLTTINILEKGGDYIFKMYGVSDSITLSYIYLASMSFEKIDFVRPLSERKLTGEFYIVCRNYLKNIPSAIIDKMFKIHSKYDSDIFMFETIDKQFFKSLLNILKKFDSEQEKNYEANLNIFREYKHKQDKLQYIYNKKYKNKFINNFVKEYCN